MSISHQIYSNYIEVLRPILKILFHIWSIFLFPLDILVFVQLKKFACEYIKLFPKHLEDEAVRWSRNVFLSLFNKIHNYGQSNNLIDKVIDNSYLEVILDQK